MEFIIDLAQRVADSGTSTKGCGIAAVILAYFFFANLAPSRKPADKAEKPPPVETNVSGQGNTTYVAGRDIVINNPGTAASNENAKRTAVEDMRKASETREMELGLRYPLGCAIFSLIGPDQVVPFQEKKGKPISLDWSKVSYSLSNGILTVRVPDLTFESGKTLKATTFELPAALGKKTSYAVSPGEGGGHNVIIKGTFPEGMINAGSSPGSLIYELEVASDEHGAAMLILGLKPRSISPNN